MQKKSLEVYLNIPIVLAYKTIQYKVPIHILISLDKIHLDDGSHKGPLQMGSCLFALPSTKGRNKCSQYSQTVKNLVSQSAEKINGWLNCAGSNTGTLFGIERKNRCPYWKSKVKPAEIN